VDAGLDLDAPHGLDPERRGCLLERLALRVDLGARRREPRRGEPLTGDLLLVVVALARVAILGLGDSGTRQRMPQRSLRRLCQRRRAPRDHDPAGEIALAWLETRELHCA